MVAVMMPLLLIFLPISVFPLGTTDKASFFSCNCTSLLSHQSNSVTLVTPLLRNHSLLPKGAK